MKGLELSSHKNIWRKRPHVLVNERSQPEEAGMVSSGTGIQGSWTHLWSRVNMSPVPTRGRWRSPHPQLGAPVSLPLADIPASSLNEVLSTPTLYLVQLELRHNSIEGPLCVEIPHSEDQGMHKKCSWPQAWLCGSEVDFGDLGSASPHPTH